MNKLKQAMWVLVEASNGNPLLSVGTVMLFYVMFNTLLAVVEKLIFGDRFEHLLDPIISLLFMAIAGYSVWWCAIFNRETRQRRS